MTATEAPDVDPDIERRTDQFMRKLNQRLTLLEDGPAVTTSSGASRRLRSGSAD